MNIHTTASIECAELESLYPSALGGANNENVINTESQTETTSTIEPLLQDRYRVHASTSNFQRCGKKLERALLILSIALEPRRG